MRDYELCPTYKIIIRYWDGKWKTFSDVYNGYELQEAIQKCKYENTQEFEYMKGYIYEIYRETETTWEYVEEW